MNELRIRDNLKLEVAYVWENPRPPKPKVPSWVKAEKLQEKLNRDKREFFIRCAFNGL